MYERYLFNQEPTGHVEAVDFYTRYHNSSGGLRLIPTWKSYWSYQGRRVRSFVRSLLPHWSLY